MSDFLVKLGKSKAEKLHDDFTMLHNETIFRIIQHVGSDGLALYATLSTYAYGKQNVMVFPRNSELAKKLNVSERTVRRWKERCEDAKLIRTVPCFKPDGMQTANVIVFNAMYPEIPDEWDTFAPNGFVLVSGTPMIREEFESVVIQGWSKMSVPKNKDGHNRPSRADRSVRVGRTKVSTPTHPEIIDVAREHTVFFEREEEELNKTNLNKTNNNTVAVVQNEIERTLGTSIPSLLPLLAEWIETYGSQTLIDKARQVRNKRNTRDIIALYRKAVTDPFWQMRNEVPATSEPVRDERYDNFYQLFPEA